MRDVLIVILPEAGIILNLLICINNANDASAYSCQSTGRAPMLLLFAFLRPEVDVSPPGGLGHRNVCFELVAVAHEQLNDRPLRPNCCPMICGAEGLLRQELPAIQTGAYFMLAMTADGTMR
jgi:hypothetical protein